MITVACVLKLGGDYNRDWVHALKRGIARHLSDYRFVCLTDDVSVEPYWRIPLSRPWPGWWSKINLFQPGLFTDRVLYLDLDTLPVGDLHQVASYSGAFAMLQDFYQPRICASGVMAWTPGPHTDAIYHAACKLTRLPGGRSDYWYARVAPKPDRLQSLYPGQIVSYKAHARAGIPENARLVCYHGKPRPNDPNAGWGYHEWGKMAYAPASQASA